MLAAVVVLAVLAWPLRTVPRDAQAAQDELTAAVQALQEGEAEAGSQQVRVARARVEDVTEATDSLGARVWSRVPFAGGGVSDVRDLGQALDHLTSALEVAVEVYPEVSGDDSRLMHDQRVNLETLDTLLAALDVVEDHLVTARGHLEDVEGTNFLVGDRSAAARDKAMGYVGPATDGLARMGPMREVLPDVLGASGPKRYVIAMMNPSEMKYSGGSMLTFNTADVRNGKLELGESLDNTTGDGFLGRSVEWDRVEDNPFPAERITHANMAPGWSVSGEETLRAWEELFPEDEPDGLIAVDVLALQRLMAVTGGFPVRGLGDVTADNLVQLTIGDYGRYARNEQDARKDLNRALAPVFAAKLFAATDLVGTMQAMADSVASRNLSFTFRDPDAAAAAAELRFDGNLAPAEHDYLGFFTQSRFGTKADYWQQKTINHRVMLREDGSARIRSELSIANLGWEQDDWDISAYTDADIDLSYGVFLPEGAKFRGQQVLRDATGRNRFWGGKREYFDRPFTLRNAQIPRGQRSTMRLVYWVPSAAELDGDSMTYRLNIDNHPTVRPERVTVTVVWPEGYEAGELPEGWELDEEGAAVWAIDELDGRTSLEVGGRRA